MIGRENDIGIIKPALFFQMPHDLTDTVVDELVAGVDLLMNLANVVGGEILAIGVSLQRFEGDEGVAGIPFSPMPGFLIQPL